MGVRTLVRLKARGDAAYQNDYHHKLRGWIWSALRGTDYDSYHDSDEMLPLSYSNPFPPRDMDEGDTRHLIFASPDRELLNILAARLDDSAELNIGEMPFTVEDITALDPDVGEPGTTGTISTGTAVVVSVSEEGLERHELSRPTGHEDSDTDVFWRPKHTVGVFFDEIRQNLQFKHDQFMPEYLTGPDEREDDVPLFDGYDLVRTPAVEANVTADERRTFITSQWVFRYTVQDDLHRKHLNHMLDVGIGARTNLGFGFVNLDEDDGNMERSFNSVGGAL